MSIPPQKWGAIEEIIWQYKVGLTKLGHEVDIVYADDVKPGEYDFAHLHVARLATESDHLSEGGFIQRGVPYIFTMHDVHPYVYGRNSEAFVSNTKAIEGSIFSTVGCKRYRDIFPKSCLNKIEWLLHGVDTDFFSSRPRPKEHKLLCVGMKEPRKQFHLALQAAEILNLPITIVGPEKDHCQEYVDKYFKSSNYPLLTLIDNSDKEALRKLHADHSILIHPALTETGNPCLAVMEAMASGLPVVGTNMDCYSNEHGDRFPDMSQIPGFLNCVHNAEDIAFRVKEIIQDYDKFSKDARQFAKENSRDKVCERIIALYNFHKSGDSNRQERMASLLDQILAHAKYLDEKEYEEKLQKLGRPHHLLPNALGDSWLTFHLKLLRKEMKC
tara:strand:+ start:151 stop:1308 length:1158 start_codon:yes stop_codon:yes gene_type:complete